MKIFDRPILKTVSAITAVTFSWLVTGGPALANASRWEGENARLRKEAADLNHVLSAKVQTILDQGAYAGSEGTTRFLRDVEKGLDLLCAQVSRMSEREIGGLLERVRKEAFESGNERALHVLADLETDRSRTLSEKVVALTDALNRDALKREISAQVAKAGSVEKYLQNVQQELQGGKLVIFAGAAVAVAFLGGLAVAFFLWLFGYGSEETQTVKPEKGKPVPVKATK